MYFTIEPSFAPLKDLLGTCYPPSTILFWENKVLWLLDNQEFLEYSKKFTTTVIFNKVNRRRYFSIWTERTEKLIDMFRQLDTANISGLSRDALTKLYRKFSKAYYDWWTITMSLELATLTLEPMLGEQLKKLYSQQNDKEYTHDFSVLTSPLVLTFYRQEQKDLLTTLTLPKSKQEEELKKHQQQYYWIYNSYLEGKTLDINYFKTELNKAKQSDYQKTLTEINEYPRAIKQEKEKIYKKIAPSNDFRKLVSLVETFSALQDERKKYNFRGEHYLQKFVEVFSQKIHLDAASLKLLVLDELSEVLHKNNATRIQNRKTAFVMMATDKEIVHYDGPNALVIAHQYTDVPNVNQNIIQGTVASMGIHSHFRGTAKIVLTIDKIGKINDGDILVTTMTSPDFVIGIKKAGAIITDVGGMLSHAAIISREFKKPCIVGTEIATKVIHDGDVVELHCDRGTVKIIKHAAT
jgi:phosphohistidine swiveling domain-containing protein